MLNTRRTLGVLALGLAAGASILPSGATAVQAHAAGLPKLATRNGSLVKPQEIFLSGDATDIVTGITWSVWNGTTAVGLGTSDILSCNPSCATGTATPYPTTIRLSAVKNGHFSKLVEKRHGLTETAHYGQPSWPEGVSAHDHQ